MVRSSYNGNEDLTTGSSTLNTRYRTISKVS
jgi:hypothetical protein